MKDLSRSRYSEEQIIAEIEKVRNTLHLDHMPSRSEINLVTKATWLTNIVMKTGGFRFWAEKLNLKIKDSETEFGYKYEKMAQEHIIGMGHEAKLTPVKFPYDILVDGVTKIDVKAGNRYYCPTGTSWYTFNLEAIYPKCDFLIVYCIDKSVIQSIFIIPAHVMLGHKQLSMGENTIYQEYADRWDLIERHCEAMKNIFTN
jgi:hypothetical protein